MTIIFDQRRGTALSSLGLLLLLQFAAALAVRADECTDPVQLQLCREIKQAADGYVDATVTIRKIDAERAVRGNDWYWSSSAHEELHRAADKADVFAHTFWAKVSSVRELASPAPPCVVECAHRALDTAKRAMSDDMEREAFFNIGRQYKP
jgi:hypothetical protein